MSYIGELTSPDCHVDMTCHWGVNMDYVVKIGFARYFHCVAMIFPLHPSSFGSKSVLDLFNTLEEESYALFSREVNIYIYY